MNIRGARTLMLTDDDTVQGDGFVMKFSPTGVRLPSSLVHGDTEVFAASTCPNPSRVGVSIEPFETAVGGRLPVGFDSTRNFTEVKLRGPAVAQIAVTYDVPYSCAGPQSLRGTSTFTMFPSGRIVRNDVVQASTGAMIDDAIMCTAPAAVMPDVQLRCDVVAMAYWSKAAERVIRDGRVQVWPLWCAACGTFSGLRKGSAWTCATCGGAT